MPIAWFLCSYKQRPAPRRNFRYCAMDDFTAQIEADGGAWREIEILGNRAMVKVRASVATLTAIASTAGFRRIPLAALDNPISSLTLAQRTAIRNEILDAGYTLAEVTAQFPDISSATLGQVLRFMASRRQKPRYDAASDTVICDGAEQLCTSVDDLDGAVT